MFDVHTPMANCQGVSRRAALRVGALSLFGLSLPRLLAAAPARDVSCILIWTDGGLSNVDTFDMKPDAPVEYRGEFKQIASTVPGMPVCEHLPFMARSMDKVCIVKSIAHTESGDHAAAQHYMLTGYPQRPDPSGQPVGSTIYPSFGALTNRQKGWKNGLPPYVLFGGKGTNYHGAGYMSSKYDALTVKSDPNAADFRVQDVTIADAVGAERTARRRRMLERLDAWQKHLEETPGALADRSEFYRQAFDLVTSPAAKRAFRLEDEPTALRDRYGRTRDGQACLLARRLVEAGVRFVTVSSSGWDTHDNNFGRLKGQLLPALDRAWSGLLEDLTQRGMLENTLVICAGEFGRTPRVNGAAGRDHYAPCNTVGLSGAGVRMGTVVGRTDAKCEAVVGRPDSTLDYAATVFQLLGLDGTKEYATDDGRPVLVNNGGVPIAGVLA
jgi:hypothetical protein